MTKIQRILTQLRRRSTQIAEMKDIIFALQHSSPNVGQLNQREKNIRLHISSSGLPDREKSALVSLLEEICLEHDLNRLNYQILSPHYQGLDIIKTSF